MNMANILVRRNTSTGWHDENSLSSYQILRNDARFQGSTSNGTFLTKDGSSIGYRNKSMDVPSGPVRIIGDTYHIRQYIFTQFTPKELLPYIEMRKTNPNIIFGVVALYVFPTAQGIHEGTGYSVGLDVDTFSGIVYGCGIRSGKFKIVVIDITNRKIDPYTRTIISGGKRLAEINLNIVVDDPIQENEIGTKYVGFSIEAIGGLNVAFNGYRYGEYKPLGILKVPGAPATLRYSVGGKLSGLTIPVSGSLSYDSNLFRSIRHPWMFFPIGTTIKTSVIVSKEWYDHLMKEYRKKNPLKPIGSRVLDFNGGMYNSALFFVLKSNNISEAYDMASYAAHGVYRARVHPGEQSDHEIILDRHTKVVAIYGEDWIHKVNYDENDPFWGDLAVRVY
nr:MAG TPA: hypothetical protein [Caudoviricetes sp.]